MTNQKDVRHCRRPARHLLRFALLGTTLLAFGQAHPTSTRFSAVMSLGSDSILLQPAKERLNMLLTVECPGLERIMLSGDGHGRAAVSEDGTPVRYYPEAIAFRFTIGSRTAADEAQPNQFETKASADHFQSNLHFRVRVFHGMHSRTYDPTDVTMLGVPADIPYDERIYHFTFKLKDIPVDDRIMLEVLDEQGNRVGKFHLQIL